MQQRPTSGHTRRAFLGLAGLAAAGAVAPRSWGSVLSSQLETRTRDGLPAVRSFLTRPDLRPPTLEVLTSDPTPREGLVLLAPFTLPQPPADEGSGPLIVDARGEPVWFLPLTKRTAMDLRVQRHRGRRVLTWWEGTVFGGYGGSWVIADSAYRTVGRVRAGNGYKGDLHDLVLTERGTALITIYNEVRADLSSVGGPVEGRLVEGVIQEIELASGKVLLEWHSLDHVALEESSELGVTTDGNVDYFHLNSVSVDRDGHLLVSARHTSAVYKLSRRTGQVIWRLGGTRSDFALGPGVAFGYQHDAQRRADGTLTLFDNAASRPNQAEPHSRAVRLALDTRAMTARLVRDYQAADPRTAWAMGNMQQLPGGDVFVGWGMHPSCTQIGPDGRVELDLRFAGRSVSYRAYRSPWVGRPTTRPTVVTARTPGGKTAVHVSWNGATEVARWQVRAGSTRSDLRPARTVARRGFETTAFLPTTPRFVDVTALDRSGAVLGTSLPTRA